MKVLVPVEGSEESERALAWAHRFLQLSAGRIDILHVTPSRVDDAPVRVAGAVVCHEDCDAYVRGLAETLHAPELVAAHCHAGQPASWILRTAEKLGSDLVLMRTSGRTGLTRALLGSVAAEVVAASPIPVLLFGPACPLASPQEPVRRILVPLDGTDFSAEILPDVRRFAHDFTSEVRLLEIVATGHAVSASIQAHRESLASTGLRVETTTDRGDPATAILDHAQRDRCDLIAMRTRSRSGLARLFMGSVAERVLRESPVPILARGPHQAGRESPPERAG